MSFSRDDIPATFGSYLLVYYLPRKATLSVGRLGECCFPRGWYFYAGSAFGPGGLRARLGHHLAPLKRFHWHVDYLRDVAELRGLWFQPGENNEHRWSADLASRNGFDFLHANFGSTDCRCTSHLVYSSARPKQSEIRVILSSAQSVNFLQI